MGVGVKRGQGGGGGETEGTRCVDVVAGDRQCVCVCRPCWSMQRTHRIQTFACTRDIIRSSIQGTER
jgi:hypothetical protein